MDKKKILKEQQNIQTANEKGGGSSSFLSALAKRKGNCFVCGKSTDGFYRYKHKLEGGKRGVTKTSPLCETCFEAKYKIGR